MATFGLNDIATTIGLVTGVAGSVLGVLAHVRDSAKIVVSLKWDMTKQDPSGKEGEKIGVISVTNVGRRPVFVSHAALRLPKGGEHSHMVISESIYGERLAEGDKPLQYIVGYELLAPYREQWRELRAQVSDSTGKEWVSKKQPKSEVPSWAK